MGKVIDKRMSEVGAERFYELGCADEAGGSLEDTVEPWSEGLFEKLKEILGAGDGAGGEATKVDAAGGEEGETKAEGAAAEKPE